MVLDTWVADSWSVVREDCREGPEQVELRLLISGSELRGATSIIRCSNRNSLPRYDINH